MQESAPSFNLSNINSTIHMYIGNHDLLGSKENS